MILALGLAASCLCPSFAIAEDPAKSTASLVYHNSRAFRLPFNIDPSERSRIKDVLLTVSEDHGRSWKPISRSTPDKPALSFRATHDGEYWFAVQTIDTEGRYYPPRSAPIEPRVKVNVDTMAPSIALEPNGRRGNVASVRWEVKDENIDLSSLILEYQSVGARDWRQIPIRRPMLLGQETFDAGTAEEIRVRASVSDRAKNFKDVVITLPDGTPGNPGADDDRSERSPPPLSSLASRDADGLPQFPKSSSSGSLPEFPAANVPQADRKGFGDSAAFDPFQNSRVASNDSRTVSAPYAAKQPMLVPSPRFSLQYAVDDAAPTGPASVELWVTQDNGRTWSRRGDDPDRQSPIQIDLGTEGTFGIKLVALSAANQGDSPPVPGEPPQMMVEVDSTPPVVRLEPVQVGTGVNTGKVAIIWQASDLHLGPKSVTISVRPEGAASAWVPIGPPVDNTGQYIWTLPANTPAKFHVKVEVADEAGNVASAETPENQPVLIDRSKPRSRILGVDPATKATMRPQNAFR